MRNFKTLLLVTFFSAVNSLSAGGAKALLEKGWVALVKDNDLEALKFFELALEKANDENETEEKAEALLNIGICYYSVSYSKGLDYATRAMNEYQKLQKSNDAIARQGRARCLQLISTIKSRQGRYREAVSLSKEAMTGLPEKNDRTGTLALVYNGLGLSYSKLGLSDSSEYYHRLGLSENELTQKLDYLPTSCIYVGEIELSNNKKEESRKFYERGLHLADSTGNRQAFVFALIGNGKWFLHFEKNEKKAEDLYLQAKNVAAGLSDKSFYMKCLEALADLKKTQKEYDKALSYTEEMSVLKDSLNSWEKQKAVHSIEAQFDLAEKDRLLKLAQKEKDIVKLSNYLLWLAVAGLLIISIGIILFLRRINVHDKQLLKTREELLVALEEQKRIKEEQMQKELLLKEEQLKTKEALVEAIQEQQRMRETHLKNEIDFKESQLSSMTLQMLKKNELFQELKEQLEQQKNQTEAEPLNKILEKGFNQHEDWQQFDRHFESINKNFYTKLRQNYPEISPNDLKICALIRLNLSIKEMAVVLNISPDSVKTARHRLRKKLQLNTEDNLTEFIMSL